MKAITRTTLLFACGLMLSRSVRAQAVVPAQPPQPADLPLPVAGQTPITLDIVPVASSARAKEPPRPLSQSDLQILDNGKPATITSFSAPSPSTKLAVILVLDAVNADYTSVAFQRTELDKFFLANEGHLAQPTALAIMTDKGLQLQDGFSTDGAPLKQELDDYSVALRTIPRSTGIYGAEERQQLGISSLELLAQKELPLHARKVVIFISPGWPLISGPQIQLSDRQHSAIFKTVVSLNNLLQQARMTLYDVNPFGAAESVLASSYYESFLKPVPSPGRTDLADLSLEVEATQSGGLVHLGTTDLARQIAVCVADAASAYQVTIVPGGGASESRDKSPYQLHTLQVQAPDGIKARTRALYYTQSPQ